MNPANTRMELNVRTIRPFFSRFENLYGKKELMKLIERTEMPLEYFNDENNWISFDYFNIILKLLVDYTGDPEIPYKFGLTAALNMSWGVMATMFKSFASCSLAYKTIISLSPRWAKTGNFKSLKLKKNKATIEYKLREDLKQNKYNCLSIQGSLASVPMYWNLPPAQINEIQCAVEGADSCIYELKWKNPPYKKTGFYYLLGGIVISLSIYIFEILENYILTSLRWIPLIIIPIIIVIVRKIISFREILKQNTKQKEDQNTTLEKNLIQIEKSNEILQEKVEDRVKELTASNKEIKKNIKYLQDNEDELIHTGKMTMVGQLAVDVANKLRKPVDKVQNNLQLIFARTTKDDKIYDSLAGAERSAKRCEKVINDLLTFSGKGPDSSYREIDINKVIEEAIDNTLEEISNPKIKLIKELAENLPKISADYLQIKQVLMILINNAYDAVNDALKKDDRKEGEIKLSTSNKNNEIIIEISDTGIGIPKNIIGKIFDPFFSTKPAGKKKGIGLTIGYNAIKRLGGKIEVHSKHNKGTSFTIHLPIKEQPRTLN
jgi:signal transduction histidine kinase